MDRGSRPRGGAAAQHDPRPGRGVNAGTRDYWREVAEAWRKIYRQDRKQDALRMRWHRFMKRWPRLAAIIGDDR